jgi:hypothetical protein
MGRGRTRRPAGFSVQPQNQTLTSPVPAGSRVTFFARPKKVTKERTFAWRRALLSRRVVCTYHRRCNREPARHRRFQLRARVDRSAGLRGCCKHRRCWFEKPGLATEPAAARQRFPCKEKLQQLTPPPTAETSSRRRQECPPPGEGIFCLLFVAVWTKSKASGGTRPAGFACVLNRAKG